MDVESNVSDEYGKILEAIGKKDMGKRPKTVVLHILKHGFVTTANLEQEYGYKHPPRAIYDVKELGIPIKKVNTKTEDGKTIARYELATDAELVRMGGRIPFQKGFKEKVSDKSVCAICVSHLHERYLQIDHRIPYQVAGDSLDRDPANFMLLCASCNRAKSWSCEHCPNKKQKDADVCARCYWADPTNYDHVAMVSIRRVTVVWQDDEVESYDVVKRMASKTDTPLPEYVKNVLRRLVGPRSTTPT